jgi:hypothetical protein
MPEPAQPGRARVWERAVADKVRARRRAKRDGMGLRLLGKCYRIFFVWWRLCFAGVFVKNCGLGVIFCVARMVWWWLIDGWFSGESHSGRFAPLEKTNTGVLRFAQNDDVKQATTTAKTKAEADPYGMTPKATAMPGGAEEFIPTLRAITTVATATARRFGGQLLCRS